MSYMKDNLMNGEEIVYEAKTHWGIFVSLKSLLTLGILPFLEMRTNSFSITDKRIIMKSGILSVTSLDSNIRSVGSININQPLLGRIFGYGTILVTGVGCDDGFKFVSNPNQFKKKFNEVTL